MTENYRRDRVEEILGKEIPEEFRGILALIHLVDYRMVDAVDDKLTFARGEGEVVAPEDRVHMELPRARGTWSSAPSPAAPPAGNLSSASD